MGTPAKPVYQYDMYGNFIREFESLTEAANNIDIKSPASIRAVCSGRAKTADGFQWRYKHEIEDPSKNIGLANYSFSEEVKTLWGMWYRHIQDRFNNPDSGRHDPDIEVHDPWKGDFDQFYDDNIKDFREFQYNNPEYKKEISCTHIWFSRIDKNEGFIPDNVKFMTPDFSARHRNETYKIIRDGRTMTAPQIVEELEAQGTKITSDSILNRARKNKDLLQPSKLAKYKFEGQYYSLGDLADKLDFDYHYVAYKLKEGLELEEAIQAYSDHTKYSFRGDSNLTYTEYVDKLVEASASEISREVIRDRLNRGIPEKEVINTPLNGNCGEYNSKAIEVFKKDEKIGEFPSMSEAGRQLDIPMTSISAAVNHREGVYKQYKFKLK